MQNSDQRITYGCAVGADVSSGGRNEWLVTNGLGGYAMGTLCGIPTRRYHGYLVAALDPPLKRLLMLAKIDETLTVYGHSYPLFANHWASGRIEPLGYHYIQHFGLEGSVPVWHYGCADALLEKRIWMQPDANTTTIQYRLLRASRPVHLALKLLTTYRDHHGSTSPDLLMHTQAVAHGLSVQAYEQATPFYLLSADAAMTAAHEWYYDYYLQMEAYRGLPAYESYLHTATVEQVLQPGQTLTLVASTEADAILDGNEALKNRQAADRQLLAQAPPELAPGPAAIQQLLLAADQFVVCRSRSGREQGHSLIAGYPWFGDWGRDTMISLPGLTLATGRPQVAASILRTYARYVDQGMLPNRFPDAGEAPEYNTADATLWYFVALRAYLHTTDDLALISDLYPVLNDIITWHRRGTRHLIHVDAADGLLYAGEPGVQLTWMDAKIGDWVVTPRVGKPVEINALWYQALHIMAEFAERLGYARQQQDFFAAAMQVQQQFQRFWYEEGGYCYDVIDGAGGPDASLRPNQLLAVSLPHSPLTPQQQKAVVDVCARELLTAHGLRSLAPDHPQYQGHYGGNQRQRDAAYHQGTVWAWLMGPFVSAHLRVYQNPGQAATFLQPLFHHLADHGMGSISEIFDGDAPYSPRGCIAQAWSVGEVLRVWQELAEAKGKST